MYLKILKKIFCPRASKNLSVIYCLFIIMALGFSSLSLATTSSIFEDLRNFSANPGELSASYFMPHDQQQKTSSLVVLLHGCAQNGEQLAKQSGLAELAQQHNFVLLVPQQSAKNNFKSCFNWFSDDNRKDIGESLSIKNMILTLQKQASVQNIYIVGLSAGGAMASAMLVNYPELFTAGAVIAGIPYPCADGLIKAIACMRSGPSQTVSELTQLAKKLNAKNTHWPKLIVFTGSKDTIVNPKNGQYLAKQWAALMQLKNSKLLSKNGYHLKQWQDINGLVQVEQIEIDNFTHGMAVNSHIKAGGSVAPFLVAAPISAAVSIIEFWGLMGEPH